MIKKLRKTVPNKNIVIQQKENPFKIHFKYSLNEYQTVEIVMQHSIRKKGYCLGIVFLLINKKWEVQERIYFTDFNSLIDYMLEKYIHPVETSDL